MKKAILRLTVLLAAFPVTPGQAAPTPEQGAAIQAMWWADNTAWERHLTDVMHQLFTCRAAEPVMDRSPCNYFVGRVLNQVYSVDDFNSSDGFLTADQMVSRVYRTGSFWREIGSAGMQENLDVAQSRANEGKAVIALYPSVSGRPGHVALVIPGRTMRSSSWGLRVPNAASFFLDAPQQSFVGRGLSNAFSAEKRGDVRLFYRAGT